MLNTQVLKQMRKLESEVLTDNFKVKITCGMSCQEVTLYSPENGNEYDVSYTSRSVQLVSLCNNLSLSNQFISLLSIFQ